MLLYFSNLRVNDRQTLALVDVDVLDHLVVADDGATSLAEQGLLLEGMFVCRRSPDEGGFLYRKALTPPLLIDFGLRHVGCLLGGTSVLEHILESMTV